LKKYLKYLCFLAFGVLLVYCHKPRNGEYYMTESGTKTTTSCPTATDCTTSSEAVSTKSVVPVEDSKKHWLYVDGKKWDKDINSVTYYNTFDENYSGGATESFTVHYSGAIKNKFLIEGTYTNSTVYTEPSGTYYTSTTGVFTLKVKK
jgi:hypothetical protein